MKVFVFFGKTMVEKGKYGLARKIYEKCIELFSNQMPLLYSGEMRALTSKGKDKIELKMSKSVKILLIAVMCLSVIYEREKKYDWLLEVLVFGYWFGKSKGG